MFESLNALHAEYVKGLENAVRVTDSREAGLVQREIDLCAKEKQLAEREVTVLNREKAVGEIRDIAARRKGEIVVLRQELARLTQQTSDARAAQRTAEDTARKIKEGVSLLSAVVV